MVGQSFRLLENYKENLGLEYHSVCQTKLGQIFVDILREHDAEEGDNQTRRGGRGGENG